MRNSNPRSELGNHVKKSLQKPIEKRVKIPENRGKTSVDISE